MAFDAVTDDEREYLATLSDAERAQYLRDRQKVRAQNRNAFAPPPQDAPPAAPRGPQAADDDEPAPRRAFNMSAFQNPQAGFMAAFGPAAQARHLQGMVDQVNDAWKDENDSRVAISREERRMAHEQQLEAMRTEALLKRLEMEAREREKDRILQKQLTTGVTNRQLVNGEWVDV